MLDGLESNGFDFLALGVVASLAVAAVRGVRVTLEEIGDEQDETVIDALAVLMEHGYVEEVNGALVPVAYDDLDTGGPGVNGLFRF
ncbi:MAG: hypothetical protein J0I49_01830 [Pseudonocardia sp.]|uniref:hypothetical protein n=1 Tax=Pseudonocardia sp. TaxID=60912 RepID=UPI001AD2A051|nr:hypothetical protein [Pseudonocardia sp.]MBN9096848.1 hypothetical protein [Pseudonocardia sp.]